MSETTISYADLTFVVDERIRRHLQSATGAAAQGNRLMREHYLIAATEGFNCWAAITGWMPAESESAGDQSRLCGMIDAARRKTFGLEP